MQVAWHVIAWLILVILYANLFSKQYFAYAVSEQKSELKTGLIVKTIVPPVVYLSLVCYLYFVHNDFQKTINIQVIDASYFDLSATNVFFENLTPIKSHVITSEMSFFDMSYVPLIFFGKMAFSLLGGVGMALLPIGLIESFINRPQEPLAFEHILAKKVLNETSQNLIDRGRQAYDLKRDIDMLEEEEGTEKDMKLKIYRQKVYELKRDFIEFEQFYEAFKETDDILEANHLYYWLALIMGVFSIIASSVVIVHTILTLSGVYGFLEAVFIAVDSFSIIFAVFLFFFVSLYLCVAVAYGTAKFTYIMIWLLDTHPMKEKTTWTDTFLLNINLWLLGTFGMITFLTNYCRIYLRFLEVDTFFNKVMSRTGILYYLKKKSVFEYMMIVFFLISVYVSFFLKTGPMIMQSKIEKKKGEVEAEKQKLIDLEKKKSQNNEFA
jgi:hypothetical protein